MALRKIADYRLILCGKQAIDGDTAQVGPGIAAHLNLPQITFVRRIEKITPELIIAERLLDEGVEVLEGSLPCVLTVVKDINKPRLPSLKSILASRKAVITHWHAADLACDAALLGLEGSPTRVVKIFIPPARGDGELLTGEPDEMVQTLMRKIKDEIIAARL
jgi:electron transfer flavoprotein beta subunit